MERPQPSRGTKGRWVVLARLNRRDRPLAFSPVINPTSPGPQLVAVQRDSDSLGQQGRTTKRITAHSESSWTWKGWVGVDIRGKSDAKTNEWACLCCVHILFLHGSLTHTRILSEKRSVFPCPLLWDARALSLRLLA